MTTFSQLKYGDPIYVLEVTGTFKKTTNYCCGNIVEISKPYEELVTALQYPMPARRKLVDVTISCDGEQKKLTVEDSKSIITDSAIGLTISTNKQEISDILKRQYDEYKSRKESVAKYEEGMQKCEALLRQLDYTEEKEPKEDPKIAELQRLVDELKGIIKQAGNMVPPLMKQMLPLNMQDAMELAS